MSSDLIITNQRCIRSHNIDFATLNGTGTASFGQIVSTKFLFKGTTWTGNVKKCQLTTNYGTEIEVCVYNDGTGIMVSKGGNKILFAHVVTSFWQNNQQNSSFGIQGIASSGNHYVRLTGILDFSQKNPLEYSYGVDGASTDIPGSYYGEAIPSPGSKNAGYLEYTCQRKVLQSGSGWALFGNMSCDGTLTNAFFNIQAPAVNDMIPMLYQRNATTLSSWYHILEVYELVNG